MVARFRIVFLLAFVLVAVLGFSALPGRSSLAANQQSSWFKNDAPSLKTIYNNYPVELLPLFSNRDCLPETKFVTIPKNILKLQKEVSHQACAVQSAFGRQSNITSGIVLNETNVSGPLKNIYGGSMQAQAIPGSEDIMLSGGGLYGLTRYILRDFTKNTDVKVQPDGSIHHQLKSGFSTESIKNPDNTLPEFTDIRFSENGRWMVGEVPFYGMSRVNLETREILRFGPPFNHANGAKPRFVSAISADGRYVVTAERDYEIFRLYDLDDCQAQCRSVDLLPFIKAQIPGYKNIHHLQFSNQNNIRFYAQSDTGGNSQYGYYLLTASGEKESGLDYLALGDSFASGEGAYSYKPGTDVREPSNKCHLSLVSYPYLLPALTSLNSAESIACSGAKMKDIYFPGGEEEYAKNHKQSQAKEEEQHDAQIYSGFLPGYRSQLSFVKQTKPAAATVSISGNDIGFGEIVLACVMPGNCYESPQERLNLFYTINSKFEEVMATLGQIKNKAASGANIYLISYPSLADPDGSCALNVHLSKPEIEFSNQLIAYLNSVLKKSAGKAGVNFIDVEKAFYGNRMCETDSSQVAVNGLTAGDDKTLSIPLKITSQNIDIYLSGRESYHPNQLGHQLLAAFIARGSNNFAARNPLSNSSAAEPVFDEAVAAAGANSLNANPRKITFNKSLVDSLVFKGKQANLKLDGLLPSSTAVVSLTPSNLVLGSLQTTTEGTLESAINIPAEIEPSLYTFHVSATNKSGEPTDTQKLVYIADSETDIDGDNVPNDQESCLLVMPSRTDYDQDNLDDACDGQISEPPAALAVFTKPTTKSPSQPLQVTGITESSTPNLEVTAPEAIIKSRVLASKVTGRKKAELTRNSAQKTQNSLIPSPILLPFLAVLTLILLLRLYRKRWRKPE